MTSNQTYLPPKINGLETRLAEQNQVERRQNADRIYNVLINNEDNEKRIKNLPRQSISDPLWDQFFNGTLAQNESTGTKFHYAHLEKELETNLFFRDESDARIKFAC
ncbi:uncharacterized protein OCT59_016809 [Rhizophagus irregularis]|uniref:Uncharacterized protein n=1 Tax=Rhizophagus irregularis TaxID=588596 RepID=A0A915Z4B3_9GLOM|nr:hypothetical protein OCT59_016809 [Rhizophagus irregularis]CAB5201269.1 unnamed protein product [Rhizophagus irregularis]CAB5362068.1 unnamed protein product [Rhizophagus irregularis]